MNAQSHALEEGASGQNLGEECILENGPRGQPEMRKQALCLEEKAREKPETEEAR